jgi:hypothetical protein
MLDVTSGGVRKSGPLRRLFVALVAVTAVAEAGVGLAELPRVGAGSWTSTVHVAVAPPRPRPDAAPLPGPAAGADRETAVRAILAQRGKALLARDKAAWLAGIDPAAKALRARQATLFDNLAAVPLASWRYILDPRAGRQLTAAAGKRYGPAKTWVPAVLLRYALKVVDAEPTERPQVLTFVQRGDHWYLGADDDAVTDGGRTWRGMWDFGRVVAYRGASSLVLAHPDNAGRMAAFADTVDGAVPRVSAVWGTGWPRKVAVLIPDGTKEMAALVGEQFALAKIAAVAIADYADARAGTARGQRVVINPENLNRLGALGRRIVLQHEITHVASRGVTGQGMPTWLVEGFADFVGYRDAGVASSVVGQDLAAQLRAHSWPGKLPADADFHGNSPRLSVAYEEAWSACTLLASRLGVPGLVRFYRAVGTAKTPGPAALDSALRRYLHESTAQFVAQWRQHVPGLVS